MKRWHTRHGKRRRYRPGLVFPRIEIPRVREATNWQEWLNKLCNELMPSYIEDFYLTARQHSAAEAIMMMSRHGGLRPREPVTLPLRRPR